MENKVKKISNKFMEKFLSISGSLLAIYLGGYWLLIRPVYWLITGYLNDTLTLKLIIVCIVKILFASTAAGGIWCAFDIMAGHFREIDE